MSDHDPREHRLCVARSARYYTLGDEAAPEVWIACHGYRQLAGRFIRSLQPLADGSRLIVAPEALSRFYLDIDEGPHGPESRVGATWMTREDREAEIGDYVGYLDAVREAVGAGAPGARTIALGFSQGAATACRWATLGRSRPDRLILWAGVVPGDPALEDVAERLRRLRPILVAGSQDAYLTADRLAAERARLDAAGVPIRLLQFEGGHRIEPGALERLTMLLRQDATTGAP
jgi:predicted esterase